MLPVAAPGSRQPGASSSLTVASASMGKVWRETETSFLEAIGGKDIHSHVGRSPSPSLPVCLHGVVFRTGSFRAPAAGLHPLPVFLSTLRLPPLSADHTAPPALPAAHCPLLSGCKPRGTDARRQCPLPTPSGERSSGRTAL